MTTRRQSPWSGYQADKDALRTRVWAQLQQQGVTVGDPVGHIPCFIGAEQAAARLATLAIWQQASVIKCNPDAAQAPVRLQALQDGKDLYMAVPRLTHARCFVALQPAALRQRGIAFPAVATHRGAMQHGRLVTFAEMQPIDLVVVGCVAVSQDGGRTGKGAGFADLELGLLRQMGLVQADTPIVTTVHNSQIVPSTQLPMLTHDWALTWIVTPDQAFATISTHVQPTGLNWEALRPEQLHTIPILRQLRPEHR
ncbi:MAG: 5-formyltetrahydrofolate cyclo-ligase [Candidatus Tectimicrobiota bacterium]